MDIHLRGHGAAILPRWREHVFNRLSKLDRFGQTLIKIDVVLNSSRHHLKGSEECRVTIKAPRKIVVLSKKAETMLEAIDAVFRVAEKKVHNLWKKEKTVKRHSRLIRMAKRGILKVR